MGLRKIATLDNPAQGLRAVVRYSAALKEYVVRFYRGTIHLAACDYFTGDKTDAIGTARAAIWLDPDGES